MCIKFLLGKKIYRVTAKIDISPAALIKQLENTEDLCKWNTTLTQHKILKVNINPVQILDVN